MKVHGIELDSEEIREFCCKWKIRELSVFGSILRDDFGPESDIDLLVDFDADAGWDMFELLHMQDELEAILGRTVDVVDKYALECDGNRFVRTQIDRTAKHVYIR